MSKSEAKSIKGIYLIEIDGKKYVGKDTQITRDKRFKEHMNALEKGNHYNKEFQNAYNDMEGEVRYRVLEISDEWSEDEHNQKEIYYIDKENSYTDGFNLTLGGFGTKGYSYTEDQLEERSKRVQGSLNPMSKITEDEFDVIYNMLMEYRTNDEIAEVVGLHPRYVSLIRHKRRLKSYWEKYPDYEPVKSDGASKRISKITQVQFLEIIQLLEDGWTNAKIERKYGLSGGTISRLRHRVTFKTWWEILYDRKRNMETFNDYRKR